MKANGYFIYIHIKNKKELTKLLKTNNIITDKFYDSNQGV